MTTQSPQNLTPRVPTWAGEGFSSCPNEASWILHLHTEIKSQNAEHVWARSPRHWEQCPAARQEWALLSQLLSQPLPDLPKMYGVSNVTTSRLTSLSPTIKGKSQESPQRVWEKKALVLPANLPHYGRVQFNADSGQLSKDSSIGSGVRETGPRSHSCKVVCCIQTVLTPLMNPAIFWSTGHTWFAYSTVVWCMASGDRFSMFKAWLCHFLAA